jgi:molybdopterin-guanine dinucleotide biosynthesis protein A
MNAYILTGGLSRRFGEDKSLARINETTFTEHIYKNICNLFETVYVVGKIQTISTLPFLKDKLEIQCPLVGLYTGLSSSSLSWNFFISVDTPLIEPDFIRFLRSYLEDSWQCVIPKTKQHHYPLTGFYHQSSLDLIKQKLDKEDYRMMDCIKLLKTRELDAEGFKTQLWNVNTKEDYAELLANMNRTSD